MRKIDPKSIGMIVAWSNLNGVNVAENLTSWESDVDPEVGLIKVKGEMHCFPDDIVEAYLYEKREKPVSRGGFYNILFFLNHDTLTKNEVDTWTR